MTNEKELINRIIVSMKPALASKEDKKEPLEVNKQNNEGEYKPIPLVISEPSEETSDKSK